MSVWAVVENGKPLQRVERPAREPKGSEVLLDVTHAGVCHSDLHFWKGYYDMGGCKRIKLTDRGVVLPRASGHEVVGRVAKLGPDAVEVQVGDVCIVFPWLGCGACDVCRSGDDNLCMKPNAVGVMQDGGFGDQVVVPHARFLVPVGPVKAVIDFVNVGSTAQVGLDLLQKAGKLVLVGVGGGEITLSLAATIFRPRTIQGSATGNPQDLREVAALARSGKLKAIPVTVMPKDQVNEALRALNDGRVKGRVVLAG